MRVERKTKKGIFKFASYSKYERKSFLFVYLLIFLPVLQFIIFWLVVNARSIMLAFQDNVTGAFTLQHFSEVFGDFTTTALKMSEGNSILMMMGRSLLLWIVVNFFGMAVGLICTYVMYRKIWLHYANRVIYAIPMIVGSVVWVGLLREIFTGTGPVVWLLTKWGAKLPESVIAGGLFASNSPVSFLTLMIIMFIQNAVGGGVIATSAFSKVPKELFEAAEIDNIGFWGQFFNVALPCAWPTISTLLTVAMCSLLVVDGNVYLFTYGTGGNMPTMGFYIYFLSVMMSDQMSAGEIVNYGYPAALGIVVTVISVPLVLLGRKLLSKIWTEVRV